MAVKAYGKTLKEAFENAALSVFNIITNSSKVESQEIKLVTKKASDLKSLLYDFLEEIIYLNDAEGLVFHSVKVEDLDEKNNTISAVFKGEPFNPKKHKAGTHVKAVTYFRMSIEKVKSVYQIEFTLDV